ncbi:hypothetical protein DL98DRAFT_635284 [Cadophora sp. DSE1049]|nr:hypothetical protein DL98DRAFT_635284 [Cadophora sp. DSE1049]
MLLNILTVGLLVFSTVNAIPVLDDSAYALNTSIPSPTEPEAFYSTQEASHASSKLKNRAWVSDNSFRLYRRHAFMTFCPPIGGVCTDHVENTCIKRDNCNWNNCSPYRNLDVMKIAESVCDKLFTACRILDARWRLKLRRTGDDLSCQPFVHAILGKGAHLQTYASLHDDANGRHIGWCWYERSHKFLEHCEGIPYNVDSIIRCLNLQ